MSYFLKTKDIETIEKHYDKYFNMAGAKKTEFVMHEMASDGMHIDLEHYAPTEKFPYHIIATVGMSGYTMKQAPFKNIELIMFLPKDWKIDKESFMDENWYWPIRLIKVAARLPYHCNSFLSVGHTFSMDADNSPLAECTNMCSGLLTFPTWIDQGVFELKYGGLFKKKVNFLCLTAINKDELDMVYKNGPQEFLDKILQKDGKDDLLIRNKR